MSTSFGLSASRAAIYRQEGLCEVGSSPGDEEGTRLKRLLLAVFAIGLCSLPAASAALAPTSRVSVSTAGAQANGHSLAASISVNGRYVAFYSSATNLVARDTNGRRDVFRRDTQTGKTTRISVSSSGQQANGESFGPSIAPDGRYVAFYSDASNLVAGDTNNADDIFVRDNQTGATTRVSVTTAGDQAEGGSYSPSISADGRYVAFLSDATNLVAGDTNRLRDVFVHDAVTGATTRRWAGRALRRRSAQTAASSRSPPSRTR
jgi:Tol biopolymer transport system component